MVTLSFVTSWFPMFISTPVKALLIGTGKGNILHKAIRIKIAINSFLTFVFIAYSPKISKRVYILSAWLHFTTYLNDHSVSI